MWLKIVDKLIFFNLVTYTTFITIGTFMKNYLNNPIIVYLFKTITVLKKNKPIDSIVKNTQPTNN